MRSCLVPVLALLASLGVAADSRPNFLVILADDMGYGDLRVYNPESKIDTPNIDRIAKQGMRFTDAHTTGSTCIPARFGLLTGTYPFRQPSMSDAKPLIPQDMPTVASLLRDGGYRTAMVGKWHLGFDDKKNPKAGKELRGGPMDRGFQSFFGIHASTDIPPYYYIDGRLPTGMPMREIAANNDDPEATGWNNIQGAFWRAGGIGQDLELEQVTPRFFAEAVAFLKKQMDADKPFFLYLALPSPHTPWLPTKEFVGKSGAGSYGDFLLTVDHGVGEVLDQLDAIGKTDDTLVLFTSDNGPVWYDRNVEKYGHASVGPLRGMKGDNWEGGHRMPFLVRLPSKVKAGSTSDALVSFLDVAATFCDLGGVEGAIPADSISFAPVLLGEKEATRTRLVHSRRSKMMLRDGKWKLLAHQGPGGFSRARWKPAKDEPEGQLYDLDVDLGEQNNLWRKKPEKVAEMRRTLNKIIGK